MDKIDELAGYFGNLSTPKPKRPPVPIFRAARPLRPKNTKINPSSNNVGIKNSALNSRIT